MADDQNTADSVDGYARTDQQSSTLLPSGVPENDQTFILCDKEFQRNSPKTSKFDCRWEPIKAYSDESAVSKLTNGMSDLVKERPQNHLDFSDAYLQKNKNQFELPLERDTLQVKNDGLEERHQNICKKEKEMKKESDSFSTAICKKQLKKLSEKCTGYENVETECKVIRSQLKSIKNDRQSLADQLYDKREELKKMKQTMKESAVHGELDMRLCKNEYKMEKEMSAVEKKWKQKTTRAQDTFKLKNENDELKKTIESLNAQIKEKDETLKKSKQMPPRAYDTIKLKNENDELKKTIESLNTQITEKDEKLKKWKQMPPRAYDTIKLKNENDELKKTIESLNTQITEKDEKLKKETAELFSKCEASVAKRQRKSLISSHF